MSSILSGQLVFAPTPTPPSLAAQQVKNPPAMGETWVQSLGQKDPLEREWQPPPVFLPGESHGPEEPGRLQSMGSQKVRHG